MKKTSLIKDDKLATKTINKKLILIIGAGLLIGIIILIVAISTNSSQNYTETGGYYDIQFEKNDDYTELLNLYNNLPNDISEEYFYSILDSGGINRKYVQIDPDSGQGFISASEIHPDVDYSDQTIEYISFDYPRNEDELTMPHLDSITYHSFHNGKHDSIFESSEGEFTHSENGLTNSYSSKWSAIDSYLMTL